MRSRRAAVFVALTLSAAALRGADITSATLQIQGTGLRIETVSVTTAIEVPTTVQTEFAGRKNDEAPNVPGLVAVGELTGPGLDTPIQLTTAPGHRFQIPGLPREGTYLLQNVRLMNGNDFAQQAAPSVAVITVANIFQPKVRVRQLTPEEIRSRGIVVDGRNFEVYEYSLSFLVDGVEVVVPFPVIIDPRTHEVTPIAKETPYTIPQSGAVQPPRWNPPEVIPFDFPPAKPEQNGDEPPPQSNSGQRLGRTKMPAALVIPNSMAVLHQFFAVALTVTNGAPEGSTATLEDLFATIKVPSALKSVKTIPPVAFGQPVPIVDPATGVTFLVAQAKGEGEWTLEGLRPGTHTVEIDIRATLKEPGQQDVPLQAAPRASIVVHDPRFNLTFSHPGTVRKGIDYTTFSFITNISPNPQTIRVANSVQPCEIAPGANICRVGGAEFDELTLGSGEMRVVEYRLRPGVTGKVFATAGTVDGDTITAAVQLHMGVSETGIPLSPATLVLPHYAQFVDDGLVSDTLALLGLGYSLATAPVNQVTARFPRLIRTDIFQRAADIARAGQRIFIAAGAAAPKRDAIANLTLDLLGNATDLREWDELRRKERYGRIAGASLIAELNETGMAGQTSVAGFVDAFGSAVSHRKDFVLAVAHGPVIPDNARPYALSLAGVSGRRAGIPNEADGGWVRDLAYADISRFDAPSLDRAGEIAIVGRITEETELVVTPTVTGAFTVEILFADANGPVRSTIEVNGNAGQPVRIALPSGATHPVVPAPLEIVAARQDLHLDREGHKVAVLFNRPVALQEGAVLRTKFAGSVAFDRDGVIYNGPRAIFAAALQEDQRIAILSFDGVLTTNAAYSIAVSPLIDPISQSEVSFPATVTPRIDNDRPAGIVFGKFIKGDNTPIAGAEVRLYTGHWQGCKSGLFDGDPPPDCNPYKEAPQYVVSESDGSFLFEYIPRDIIADPELAGGYMLIGVQPDGKFSKVDGAVRLPGRVHFVNIQLLGRGTVEGFVRYENGQKVAGADVYAGSTMFNIGRRAKTDANGFYHVEDLAVGPTTVSATDADGNVAFASTEIATPGQVATKDLMIIRKPFPGTGTVFGVVRRSDDNSPVRGARVGVSSQGYAMDEAFTDADGRFEFRKVPAGFVTILAAEFSIAREVSVKEFDLRPDEVFETNPVLSVIDATQIATTLTGTVLREDPLAQGDSSKYQRVPGAVVEIGGLAVTADAVGNFAFDPVYVHWTQGRTMPIKAYDPATRRTGEQDLPTLTESGPNHVTIFIPANSYGRGIARVRLVNAHGAPVSGFRVIEPGFPPTLLTSVGGGVYEYRDAPVGSGIEIWAVQGPGDYGDQHAKGTVRLEFPGQVSTLTLRLPGQGTVRAKLRGDFDVIGDVDLTYQVWEDGEQALVPKTITRSTSNDGIAGFATFEKVPALQTYRVDSNHPSFGHAEALGTLAYDGDLIDHTLELNKLSKVTGFVHAIDGVTPIAGASVVLHDGARDAGVLISQPDGSFTFHDVPSSIRFSVNADAVQSGILRKGTASGSTPALGGTVTVNVVMRRRGNVEGRVVYADDTPDDLSDNEPVPLAKLWLRELDFPGRAFGTPAEPLTADITGRFAISNVFVGPLRAAAWDPGNQELRGDWTGRLSEEGEVLGDVFIVIGGDGTGSVRVTVVDPNQSLEIANAEVGLYRSGGLFDFATTIGDGTTRFEQVPVGNYAVSAYSKALGKSGASIAFSVTRDLTADVRVLLEFSGKVDGTLSDPESSPPERPIPGAQVLLRGFNFSAASTTDLTGLFSFAGVREGSFELTAKDTTTNRRAEGQGTLSAANPHPVVDLHLEPTETLHFAAYLPDDFGAKSGVLAPPLAVEVFQRCGPQRSNCDFRRADENNPVIMPGLLRNASYGIHLREIGGLGRQFDTGGEFPIGTAANPFAFVFPAYGDVEVTVSQGGVAAAGSKVRVGGITLFADSAGKALAHGLRLGSVSAQATSIDETFSGSASGTLLRQSVPLALAIELGDNAGITGLVEAEGGGPSIGTRVVATYVRTVEVLTDGEGRYTFQGIPTPSNVGLTYSGP
ncbi:MAG TPA: carboxypeptidase-like regulatory domain-containing protein, partial [Thermoanaerobaculia bacterium]|nr:carboxypeptidase-like regulatory domain-containing protein [Thermoanaerobaculia bacterium]